MNYKLTLFSGLLLFLFAAFIFSGCEQKKEIPEEETQPVQIDTSSQQTPAQDTIQMQKQLPDITGEWKGDFGNRKMTLTIKSQDKNTFEGETVVRWDSPKKEKVTGEINFDTREMKIKETAGTRNNGNYTGTVSADMKTFIGVWRDNGNRLTYNISLTKQ